MQHAKLNYLRHGLGKAAKNSWGSCRRWEHRCSVGVGCCHVCCKCHGRPRPAQNDSGSACSTTGAAAVCTYPLLTSPGLNPMRNASQNLQRFMNYDLHMSSQVQREPRMGVQCTFWIGGVSHSSGAASGGCVTVCRMFHRPSLLRLPMATKSCQTASPAHQEGHLCFVRRRRAAML